MDLKELISLGLALLAVGVIFLAYTRRRHPAKAEPEKHIGQARRRRFVRRRRFIEVVQEKRSGLPRRNRDCPPGGMNNIVTDEADPLAEAEAYLTRGRDRNAESVLKEAIAKDPSRYELKLAELKLELLAIYRQRHDASAFDPLAEELYAELGGRGGELWDRLEAMGRCLNPHNPVPRALPGDNMHGDVATQRDVSAIRNYREVERRKRSRRTIADRRDDETSWRPTVVNRRQTPGRRREDRF